MSQSSSLFHCYILTRLSKDVKVIIALAQAGYPYIVGYHKRGRIVSDTLFQTYTEVSSYAKLKDNRSYLEVPTVHVEDDKKDLFEQELQVLYRRLWQIESDKALKIPDEAERTKNN